MDKKNVIFQAAAQAVINKYSHDVLIAENTQKEIKTCFKLWYQLFSDLHDEL
jgi:hypothetical protein